jgi:hypothetical protein
MQKGITEFLNYNQLPLSTPPGAGVNPPAGSVFMWHTLDGSNNLVINYRLPDGTDKTFTAGGGGSSITFASYSWVIPYGTAENVWNSDLSTWKKFALNSASSENNITGASLASNQITLPAGTYLYQGNFATDSEAGTTTCLRLYNVTDSAQVIASAHFGNSGGTSPTSPTLHEQKFTISDSKVFEFQLWHNNRIDPKYYTVNPGYDSPHANISFKKIG